MPPESQHTEWKAAWHDDHLRWVCGFANAEGGRLEIGRNDRGAIVGLADASKLLEDLPNKIRDALGVLVAVNLHQSEGRDWLEIVVEAYPNPINLRGRYYQRSGSTLQELKGAALDRFLLRKQGRTWDGVPVPRVGLADLAPAALEAFRQRARRAGRVEPSTLTEPNAALLEKLQLLEGDYLKRAALLLFHPEPSRFFPGAFVKIGYFDRTGELVYHDEVQGDLFGQVDRTLDLLLTKYLKAAITYEGVQRIERFPMPRAALREAVLNALVHRDYAVGAPVQIRVYADCLKLWNPAVLPEGWTFTKLLGQHASQPYNPSVANAFFRGGEIEAWGRGIQRIFEECKAADTPAPDLQLDGHDLWTEFVFAPDYLTAVEGGFRAPPGPLSEEQKPRDEIQKWGEKWGEKATAKRLKILTAMRRNPRISTMALASELGLATSALEKHLKTLKEAGCLKRIGPAKGGHWQVVFFSPDTAP
jgi:ATP-dependent DNA helicase RecG